MRKNNEPDRMHRALAIVTMVMTVLYMYKCWQIDQLLRMI